MLDDTDDDDEPRPARTRWGWLLKHMFHENVDVCSRCGGPMRWLEAATTPDSIARLMASHGLAPRLPPKIPQPPALPGQLKLPSER